MAEWTKASGCKPDLSEYGGSNPSACTNRLVCLAQMVLK